MKTHILDEAALSAISPLALMAYVTFEGWSRHGSYGQHAEVYQKDGPRGTFELLLPITPEIGDYASAVSAAIKYLAAVEERDEVAIYRDLTRAARDVIRVRAPEADEDGSIEVGAGVGIVQHARDLLAAAACAAVDPRPAYHVGKQQKATDYMRKVRLGQTEQGSFVVTLLAPIPPLLELTQVSLWPDLDDEPFERQVTRCLADALEAAHVAVGEAARGEGMAAFRRAVPAGVSANLCEAVAAIIDEGDGADLSITWARTRPAPHARTRVKFGRDDADILREVARKFRLQEPRRDETILGYVVNLTRDQEEDGQIAIKALIDGKARSLRTVLNPEDYAVALEAHGARAPVTLTGDLEMESQRWQLANPRNLRIVGAGDDGVTEPF